MACVAALLAAPGILVNEPDGNRRTALFWAASRGLGCCSPSLRSGLYLKGCREDYAACLQLLLRAPAAVLDAQRVAELSVAITISVEADRAQVPVDSDTSGDDESGSSVSLLRSEIGLALELGAQTDVHRNPMSNGAPDLLRSFIDTTTVIACGGLNCCSSIVFGFFMILIGLFVYYVIILP